MDTDRATETGAYVRLLENQYGEYDAYRHIKRDHLQGYRRLSIATMVEDTQSISVITPCGRACIISCWYNPWYDTKRIGIEQLLYVHPKHRRSRLAHEVIDQWLARGIAEDVHEFHAGSLIGYRPKLLVRLYGQHGFVQQGLTLIKTMGQ